MVALGAKSALALLSVVVVQPIIKRFNENQKLNKQDHVVLGAQSVWNYQSLNERDDSSLSSTQVMEFHVFEGLRPMRRRDKSWPWWPYPVQGSAQIKFHGAFALNRIVDGPVDLHATDTTSA